MYKGGRVLPKSSLEDLKAWEAWDWWLLRLSSHATEEWLVRDVLHPLWHCLSVLGCFGIQEVPEGVKDSFSFMVEGVGDRLPVRGQLPVVCRLTPVPGPLQLLKAS